MWSINDYCYFSPKQSISITPFKAQGLSQKRESEKIQVPQGRDSELYSGTHCRCLPAQDTGQADTVTVSSCIGKGADELSLSQGAYWQVTVACGAGFMLYS